MNRSNKAKFVSPDVENKHIAHFVGAREECSQLCKIAPIGFSAKPIPIIQSTGTLRMRLLRCHDPAMGNDVHAEQCISK